MRKKTIGIDLNQVVRAYLFAFEKYYIKDFGGDNIKYPVNSLDVKKHFPFYNTQKLMKYLKTEEAPVKLADVIDKVNVFDESNLYDEKKEKYTKKSNFEQFLYDDYAMEIFGHANNIYPNIGNDLNAFYDRNKDKYNIMFLSIEKEKSIGATLFFLSKLAPLIRNIKFVKNVKEIWNSCNLYITSNLETVNKKPKGKKVIYVNDGTLLPTNNSDHIINNFSELLTFDFSEIFENKLKVLN